MTSASRGGSPERFEVVAAELTSEIGSWPDSPGWTEERLETWARRAFALQYTQNIPYRRYCDARCVTPGAVSGWRDVPPVPTAAFAAVDLITGRAEDASLTFWTSGTSSGGTRRGRHLVRAPALYRMALRAAFRTFVTQDDQLQIVTLLPSFTVDDGSSLGWMLDDVREFFGGPGSTSVATPEGIAWGVLERVVRDAMEADRPVCLAGTTVAFAEWLERLRSVEPGGWELPRGSRLMDTGGAKGLRDLDRDDVIGELATLLDLPADRVINELGMTELLSQRYRVGLGPGPHAGPPWLRTRILDPVSLNELPTGETGLLCHYDLANLGSVCAVVTEDVGRIVEAGVEWQGRMPGAPPRGCSLATAELLEAQGDA